MTNQLAMEEFAEDYRSARMYHFRANQFLAEGQYHSVVFNVAAVALENYLIALCHLFGVEPCNHNYTCLMDAVEEVAEVPGSLNEEIRSLDTIFGICSIENYHHGLPAPADAGRILKICEDVKALFDPEKMAAVKAALGKD